MDNVSKSLAALDKPAEPILVAPMNILHAKNMDSFMKVHADFVVVLGMLVLILAILEKLKTKKKKQTSSSS